MLEVSVHMVRLLRRKIVSALVLGLIALAVVVSTYQAVAEDPRGLQVGDVLRLESVRGMAHDQDTGKTTKATLSLTLTVTSVNKTRVRFVVTSGQISFGDAVYTVGSGAGGALVRKFGWIVLHGNATLSSGRVLAFRLEGMLHLERRGVVVAGLVGGIGDGSSHNRLRFLARVSKI